MWGSTKGACDAVGMVRNEEKGKFSPNKFRDFLRGGRIQGDVCGGDCWEIKDQIGEKKHFRGPEIFGGVLFGEMQKRGGKTFLGECWGSCEPQQILGGEFLEKCQRKKCDVVGMVRNEKKGKFSPKTIRRHL